MFKPGDKVFYPHHGAGILEKIEEIEVLKKKQTYCVIKFHLTETLMKIPVDKCEELGLRNLSDTKEIKRCFKIIASGKGRVEEDWKVRYKEHQDMLRSGKLSEISDVVINLYERNAIKELSSTEKKLYHGAIDMVASEVALALGKEENDVKNEVWRLLEERAEKAEKISE